MIENSVAEDDKTFSPLEGEQRVHISKAKKNGCNKKRHIFGDEWMFKVGGRRKHRSSKKDRADSKEQRMWQW